ncbi:MAG TPA: class I adenylate-forming enzyme family protein [Candidatus Binatia bacterium]|nr:class I adenylate-forming enzyme family protein [Candidatus Binatia bacterium]
MLYDHWREIVREYRSEIALRDLGARQQWTFAELDSLAESGTPERVVFPQGSDVEFIVSVLKGWRSGAIVCPLEPGQPRPEFPLPDEDIVHLKTTSATTGPARLVALTADQLAADARSIIETMGLRRERPNLGVISLAHSYGFSNLVTPLLLNGIPLYVASSALPETVRKTLEEMGAATLPSVPALWRAWFEAGALDSKHVRLAISAGAPLPLQLETEVFDRCGIKIHNFYGSTECGGIAYDASEKPRTDSSCIGLPMRNVKLAIAADCCLEVHSQAVAETYWPEAEERLSNGRFHTSDIAEIVDQRVYLRGRASDIINVAGRKIAPESIENVLAKYSRVRQCVVFGIPEGERERIVACASVERGTSADDLKQFLLAHLPGWQVPRDFWLIEDLSPDQRGKLSRALWRTKYLERHKPS